MRTESLYRRSLGKESASQRRLSAIRNWKFSGFTSVRGSFGTSSLNICFKFKTTDNVSENDEYVSLSRYVYNDQISIQKRVTRRRAVNSDHLTFNRNVIKYIK